ncbi:MAG TPA: DNA translocase FtsK 4TM domain-containing protein, partial [Saprospiraceae bacterium]|nr:DNA translocase FtsK 4TM domain-containing protein [Saprospiraceae bacterium]
MSASKKTKSKQSTPKNLKNRIPKILGLSFILLASFLFVAFISYLFTWQADQDKVLRFSWGLLFEENVTAENFLGRFGAIVSNMFFYWGIGLASFVIVYLFAWAGAHLLKDKKPKIKHVLHIATGNDAKKYDFLYSAKSQYDGGKGLTRSRG